MITRMCNFIYVCALVLIWVICLNIVIMYLCSCGYKFLSLSNYLLINLYYKTDLLNSDVLRTISAYYCLIIGFTDLTININFVNYSLNIAGLLFQLRSPNRMYFGIHKRQLMKLLC